MSKDQPVSLRLSQEILDRLDALIPQLEKLPGVDNPSRAKVMRRAIFEGVQMLENLFLKQKYDPANGVSGYAAIWKGDGPDDSGWVASESMISLQKLLARLELPSPQIFQEVIVQPTVEELKVLMEEPDDS